MSCSTYKHYQNAVDSIRDALIAALNNDEETETLEDVWSYYLGMRSITDSTFKHIYDGEDDSLTFSSTSSVNDHWMDDGFSITGNPGAASSDTIDFTGMSSAIYAADTVPMDGILGGVGQDIVTFS